MNNQLFGGGFLGQVPFMGQNYPNRRPVSQESRLPSRELTDEQLDDWEAEHGAAPPGSHPSRPYVSPEERRAEEEAAAQAQADADAAAQAEADAAAREQADADAAAQAEADAAAQEQAEADAAAQAQADEAARAQAESDAAAQAQAEADAPDTYRKTVDALCETANRFDMQDIEWEETRSEFTAGEAAALSSVPGHLQRVVQNAARKKCPKYARLSLWMAVETFHAAEARKPTAPIVVEPGRESVASPRSVAEMQHLPQETRDDPASWAAVRERWPDVTTPGGGTPTPATVQEEEVEDSTTGMGLCPPGFTRMPNGQCAPDQASGQPGGGGGGIPGVASLPDSGVGVANVPTGGGIPGGMPGGGMPGGGDPFDPMANVQMTGRYPVMNL